jgi:hypothetical protein
MKYVNTLILLCAFLVPNLLVAQTTITEKTSGMVPLNGYFDFWWDDSEGKIWLEIDKLGQEVLYVNALAAGMGSNDIGLDRGQLGNTRIVIFDRVGPKVLMRQPNYDYRASTDNYLERKSVDEAFAESILWGFTVAAEQGDRVLIDFTDFLLRDAHGVAETLRRTNQGSFSVDKSRSAIYMPGTMNFPKNSEFEATITFTGTGAGGWARSVTPSPDAITLRLHHSLIELPDQNYKPRKQDPRSGYFGITYQDYSAPIGGDFVQHYISRHRLEKKDPAAAVSEAVEPIVYYLDNGTPEPVRSALLDGARWWNDAFEAIGYKDAFRVEMLPDDAHPLDVRYNVIQWIHRSTRGWSYGASVSDPRTGEIIKGHVSLGSLRVRQDFLIAEGLLGPYEDGAQPDSRMLEMALARIRQLSAHEIGHTIGIAHNFAASINDRASVMDYPHPKVTIHADGSFDLTNAYSTGIGAWDIQAVKYGYQHFPDGTDEDTALNDILLETIDNGLLYISDRDARAQGGAHPFAHLWDYGTDPITQMAHIMDVRQKALNRFSERMIRHGQPMAALHDVLVPMYLFHRYQVESTVKLLGGVHYNYNARGDGQSGPTAVDQKQQHEALKAMMQTLNPSLLALPEHILDLIPPQPTGRPISREQFRGYTDPTIDPIMMAESAADLSVSLLLHPSRLARIALQHARDPYQLSLSTYLETLINSTVKASQQNGYNGTIHRAVNQVMMKNLLAAAASSNNTPDVTAALTFYLNHLESWLTQQSQNSLRSQSYQPATAHYLNLMNMIKKFGENPALFDSPRVPYTPPGAPIGTTDTDFLSCSLH